MSHGGKYALLFGFWGNWFADAFLRYSLHSLLNPGNLPRASLGHDLAIKIATTATCRRLLDADPLFTQVCRNYSVRVLTFPDAHTEGSDRQDAKYCVWASMLNPLIRESCDEGRGLLFLHPDSLYPNGFLSSVISSAQAGKKLIFTAGVRVDSARMASILPPDGRPRLPLSGQAFEAMTIANLHEFARRHYWRSETLSHWPSALFYELDASVTVARFFDMHPIYVDHTVGNFPIKVNLDVDYDFEVLARLLAKGQRNLVDVLSGEDSYFASLTTPDNTWATRLSLVGDDALAPLEPRPFPRNDSEKFLHVAKWGSKYVPLKKVLCFQPLFIFRTQSPGGGFPAQRAFEFSLLCDSLLNYFPLLHEQRPPFSLELPALDVRIEI